MASHWQPTPGEWDGAYPLIRLAFTKNSGLRINRSMIFTIPGKNRCTEAGISGIHIYPKGNQLRLPLSLVLGIGQVQSHTELQEDASIRKCKAGIDWTTINNISILSWTQIRSWHHQMANTGDEQNRTYLPNLQKGAESLVPMGRVWSSTSPKVAPPFRIFGATGFLVPSP